MQVPKRGSTEAGLLLSVQEEQRGGVATGALPRMGTFHPSQQNTFTGKLTPAMIDAVLERARQLSEGS